MTVVGDVGLAFAVGSSYCTFSVVSRPVVNDKVILYNLGSGGQLAVPSLTFNLDDYAWVIPTFDFKGFDWKFDLDWNLILSPLGSAESQLTDIEYLGNNTLITCGLSSKRLYRSTDNGVTWAVANLGIGLTHNNFWKFLSLGSGVVLAGTQNNITTGSFQIWKSEDYGATWTLKQTISLSNEFVYGCCRGIKRDPVTGALFTYSDNSGRLWKSTDTGDTWILKYTFGEYISCLLAHSNGYLYVQNGREGVCRVNRSTDGGTSFTEVATLGNPPHFYYAFDAMVGTDDPTYIVVGGATSEHGTPGPALIRIHNINTWSWTETYVGNAGDSAVDLENIPGSRIPPEELSWVVGAIRNNIVYNWEQHSPDGSFCAGKACTSGYIGGITYAAGTTLYATLGKEVWKTTDIGRNWTLVKKF